MIISVLVAMDERRGIGKLGRLPWRLSTDLRRFRQLTMGHHIVVGRKTYESIGKPLPGRQMIVVSRSPGYEAAGCAIAPTLDQAIETARDSGETELFICGGAQIYAQSLARAERLYLTEVHADSRADTFFPEFDRAEWLETAREDHAADEKNDYSFTFLDLVRKGDGTTDEHR